jgi:AcrR family transcriptional regulator
MSEAREIDTKCRIMAMAEKLFRDIGYQKTTVADIARALAMSPANIYRFFHSKREINETVALRLIGEVEDAVERIACGPGSAEERLRRVIRAVHEMNAERFVHDAKIHEMVHAALSESWDIVEGYIARMNARVAGLIENGVATGEFRAVDAAVTAACVNAAVVRFSHPGLMMECARMEQPTLDDMLDFLMRALQKA